MSALAAYNEFTGPPVDVVQAKSGDFAPAQTEPHQQVQDGEVPSAGPCPPIATLEQLRHRVGIDGAWEPRHPPPRCLGHRLGQISGSPAVDVEKAQYRAGRTRPLRPQHVLGRRSLSVGVRVNHRVTRGSDLL